MASLTAAVLVVDGLAGQRVHADLRHAHWRLLHVAMETQNLCSVCRVLHHLDMGRLPSSLVVYETHESFPCNVPDNNNIFS